MAEETQDAGDRGGGWERMFERGSLGLVRLGVSVLRLAGRRITIPLVHAVVSYFFVTDRSRRRASLAFLRRVYATPVGRKTLGHPPGLRDVHRHYRAITNSVIDRASLWIGDTQDFSFDAHGEEIFEKIWSDERGAIVLGSHLGSFDALRLLAVRHRMVANVLMYTEHAPHINRVFRELSPEAEARVIPIGNDPLKSAFEIRRCIDRGELVCILGDRMPPDERGRTLTVSLLGDSVRIPAAPYDLATVIGCPLVAMLALRRSPLRYEVFMEMLCEGERLPRAQREVRVQALADHYAALLQHHAERSPFEWFNFFDYWGDAESDAR